MKGKKDFQKLFKKVGRITTGIAFLILAIVIVWALVEKEDEVNIPSIWGILFVISIVALLAFTVVGWAFDLLDGMRNNTASYVKECFWEAMVFLIVFGVAHYFQHEIDGSWLAVFLKAMAALCGSRGIKYIWSKMNEKEQGVQ